MADFLTRLAQRTLGQAALAQPLLVPNAPPTPLVEEASPPVTHPEAAWPAETPGTPPSFPLANPEPLVSRTDDPRRQPGPPETGLGSQELPFAGTPPPAPSRERVPELPPTTTEPTGPLDFAVPAAETISPGPGTRRGEPTSPPLPGPTSETNAGEHRGGETTPYRAAPVPAPATPARPPRLEPGTGRPEPRLTASEGLVDTASEQPTSPLAAAVDRSTPGPLAVPGEPHRPFTGSPDEAEGASRPRRSQGTVFRSDPRSPGLPPETGRNSEGQSPGEPPASGHTIPESLVHRPAAELTGPTLSNLTWTRPGNAAPGRGEPAPAQSPVRVTIGRVEIRANLPDPAPAAPVRYRPSLGLQEYLKQRNQGQR